MERREHGNAGVVWSSHTSLYSFAMMCDEIQRRLGIRGVTGARSRGQKDNGSAKRAVHAAIMECDEARESPAHDCCSPYILLNLVLPFARAALWTK